MSAWPKEKTVAAAFAGRVAEVIQVPEVGPMRGIRSANPNVFVVIGEEPRMICTTCKSAAEFPDPPASMPDKAQRTALLAVGTKGHALFALTAMHQWSRDHAHEAPKTEEE